MEQRVITYSKYHNCDDLQDVLEHEIIGKLTYGGVLIVAIHTFQVWESDGLWYMSVVVWTTDEVNNDEGDEWAELISKGLDLYERA